MNRLFLISLFFILFSCSSVPKSDSKYYSFDEALEIGIQKIETDLPEGTDIAIIDFKSNNPNLSSYIIEEMYDKLINGKKLSVMERNRTDTIKTEVGYQLSGEVDDSQIINIGKQLGANYVITGEIAFSGEAYRLRVFAIDIEKGRRVASSSLNINSNDKQVNYLISLNNNNDILKGYISVETIKKPSIGNISVITGSLQLSVLSSCIVSFDFGNFSEQINLPASGTIPIDNINPGFYYITIEYSDYVFQNIGFNILPNETTNLSLGYKSGLIPHFPPVSKIEQKNILAQDGIPEWADVFFSPQKIKINITGHDGIPEEAYVPSSPQERIINISLQDGMPGWANKFYYNNFSYSIDDYSIWGLGKSNDRYTAEKNAYVNIARTISTVTTHRLLTESNGLPIWEESFSKTEDISKIASQSNILYVSYDPKTKIFWVLAEISSKFNVIQDPAQAAPKLSVPAIATFDAAERFNEIFEKEVKPEN